MFIILYVQIQEYEYVQQPKSNYHRILKCMPISSGSCVFAAKWTERKKTLWLSAAYTVDGVLWFPRKPLPWQWCASPWGASLHNLPHWSCFYISVLLSILHSAVMGHKSSNITYCCWDSCISSPKQNKYRHYSEKSFHTFLSDEKNVKWLPPSKLYSVPLVLQTSPGMWKYWLRKYPPI